jgi:tetratricopeptide (TPR) repeat protein
VTSAPGWQGDLQELVDRLLDEPSPQAAAELVEQTRRCDVRADDDVNFALGQLFRVVDGLAGFEVAQVALAEAMEVALASFGASGSPQFARGLAAHLQGRGLSDLSLYLLDRAIGLEAGEESAGSAELVNQKGEVLRQTGRLSDAEVAFKAALAALAAAPAPSDAGRAAVLNNLGLVYYEQGDLLRARSHLIESLELSERLGADPLGLAVTLDNLGGIEAALAKAAGPLRLTDDYVNAVVGEHLRQAEEYFDRARELFESGLPDSSEDYVISLQHAAGAAAQRGDRGERESLSSRALELAEQGPVSIGTMWDAVALRGEVLLESGEPGEAVELLSARFQRLMPQMEAHERVSRGLTTLLRAAATVDDRGLAESVAEAIADIDAEVLPRRLAGLSEAEVRHVFGPFRQRTELVLGACLPAATSGVAPSWLYALVLNTKGVLVERQGSAWLQARLLGGAGAELLAKVRELRAEVACLDLDGSGSEAIRAARQRHADAERRLGDVEGELQRELGALGLAVPQVTVGDVQSRLPADALLLDFARMERPDGSLRHVLFEVRAEGPVRFRDLGGVDEVDARLGALTSELEAPPADGANDAKRAMRVRELAPVLFAADEILERELLVSPTGGWGLIPFCLLPDEAGRPLIDHHLVTLIPSARWIVTRRAADGDGAAAGPSVVLGDPDFDLGLSDQVSSLSTRVPRLERTGAEAKEVAGLLGVTPAVERDATRQRLLDVSRPRVLHVAAHGVFLDAIGSLAEQREPRAQVLRSVAGAVVSEESDALGVVTTLQRSRVEWLGEVGPAGQLSRSALLLAGFNAWLAGVATPADVGIGMLSAGEFALLDLAGTELVVLSACETGVGAVDWADGSLMGLRTAALCAGAASCISTLWNVEDEAAATLVSELYRGLASGSGRGESLRAAQLALREQHSDTYFWAGWVLEGSSSPVA